MKLAVLLGSLAVLCAATFAVQTGSAQTTTEPIRLFGCLQGDGTDQNPWLLTGAVLPPPPGPAPETGPGGRGRGGAGAGGGAGAAAGGGRGGDGRGAGAGAAAGGGRGGDGRGAGAGAAAGGGRGGDGRGAAAPAAPPPPPQYVNLRLTGVNMTPWRRMYVEVHGNLGARPASGPQEFRVVFARSAQGECR